MGFRVYNQISANVKPLEIVEQPIKIKLFQAADPEITRITHTNSLYYNSVRCDLTLAAAARAARLL